jgi:hypothetical protein
MNGYAVIELSAGEFPELTPGRLLSSWQLDAPALLLVVLLGTFYGWGVARLRSPPGSEAGTG